MAPEPDPQMKKSAAASNATTLTLQSCARDDVNGTLYIQICDEDSRTAATALRQALQPAVVFR
jgi:deferrochelatase/peroxidase EfeB